MKLTGSYEIYAPRETVWRTITQPESLKGCIPGCQRLDDVGKVTMRPPSARNWGQCGATSAPR